MTWEGGDKPKIVTNGDKGGRGRGEESHFCGDVIFERPLRGKEWPENIALGYTNLGIASRIEMKKHRLQIPIMLKK